MSYERLCILCIWSWREHTNHIEIFLKHLHLNVLFIFRKLNSLLSWYCPWCLALNFFCEVSVNLSLSVYHITEQTHDWMDVEWLASSDPPLGSEPVKWNLFVSRGIANTRLLLKADECLLVHYLLPTNNTPVERRPRLGSDWRIFSFTSV